RAADQPPARAAGRDPARRSRRPARVGAANRLAPGGVDHPVVGPDADLADRADPLAVAPQLGRAFSSLAVRQEQCASGILALKLNAFPGLGTVPAEDQAVVRHGVVLPPLMHRKIVSGGGLGA